MTFSAVKLSGVSKFDTRAELTGIWAIVLLSLKSSNSIFFISP